MTEPAPLLYPLKISKATFECLTSNVPRLMPDAPMPSKCNIQLKKSDCGKYLICHEPGSFSVIFVLPCETNPDGLALTIFGSKQVWSNFLCNTGVWWTINGEYVKFKNAEQVFKAACVICHMDPDDSTSPQALQLLDVLAAVMSAESPSKCKAATSAIPPNVFDGTKWDEMSFYPMVKAQELKCTGDVYYENMQAVGTLAKEHGIRRCYFAEAIGDRDKRWGTGLTVDDMTLAVIDHVQDPVWVKMGLGVPLPFPGKNLMGEALTVAARFVLGNDLEFVGTPSDDYIDRMGRVCPLFFYSTEDSPQKDDKRPGMTENVIEPDSGSSPKRARIMSDDGYGDDDPVTADWVVRTGSDELTSGNDEPVEGRYSLAGMSQKIDETND